MALGVGALDLGIWGFRIWGLGLKGGRENNNTLHTINKWAV